MKWYLWYIAWFYIIHFPTNLIWQKKFTIFQFQKRKSYLNWKYTYNLIKFKLENYNFVTNARKRRQQWGKYIFISFYLTERFPLQQYLCIRTLAFLPFHSYIYSIAFVFSPFFYSTFFLLLLVFNELKMTNEKYIALSFMQDSKMKKKCFKIYNKDLWRGAGHGRADTPAIAAVWTLAAG